MLSNSGRSTLPLVIGFSLLTLTGFGTPNRNNVPEPINTALPDSSDLVSIPDSLQGKDAIVLFQDKNLSYRIDNTDNGYTILLNQTEVLRKKIKILTDKGLDDYSRINLHVNKYFDLERIAINIIKPDGAVIKIKTEIHSIQEPDDDLRINEKHLRISIPNLEVGDIVDLDTKITNPTGLNYPMEVFIHEEVPALNSTFSIRFKKGLCSKIRTCNGMPSPQFSDEWGDSTYTWKFPYIPAVPPQMNSIPANELPFVRYMITNIKNPGKYGIWLNPYDIPGSWRGFFQYFTQAMIRGDTKAKKSEYYQEFLYRKLKDCDTMTNLRKLRKIVAFINDSMQLTENERSGKFSSGYYLFNRKIDYSGLLALYLDLLRSFNFEVYYIFARDKTDGEIDTTMVSHHTYSNYFFAFKSDSGALHYLCPRGIYYKPEIDQIEWRFQGTHAFLVKAIDPANYGMIRLPKWNSYENTRNMDGRIRIDADNNYSYSEMHIRFSGTKSMQNKAFNGFHEKDSLRYYFDKSIKERFDGFILEDYQEDKNDEVFPFSTLITCTGKLNNVITRIDEGTWTFPLRTWLNHSNALSLDMNRSLDYYLQAPYSEKYSYDFIFPFPVEVINRKILQCNYSNTYGGYTLSINQKDPNTISVESTYNMSTDHIPKNDYGMLKEINAHWENFKDSRLMIRKL